MPPEMRTRATLRSAEFGFFGVVVYTRVHTPRRCGAATFFLRPLPDLRPGVDSFLDFGVRPLRTSWLVVGMRRVMVAKSGRSPRPGGASSGTCGLLVIVCGTQRTHGPPSRSPASRIGNGE